MAKTTLPTDYKDDVLSTSMNGKRRYKEVSNSDGTFSLEDATTYAQVGSDFGAEQLNAITEAVNESADASKIIDEVEDIESVTENGYIAGAKALNQVNSKLGGLQFGQDAEGNWGYKPSGADAVIPFKSGGDFLIRHCEITDGVWSGAELSDDSWVVLGTADVTSSWTYYFDSPIDHTKINYVQVTMFARENWIRFRRGYKSGTTEIQNRYVIYVSAVGSTGHYGPESGGVAIYNNYATLYYREDYEPATSSESNQADIMHIDIYDDHLTIWFGHIEHNTFAIRTTRPQFFFSIGFED